MKVANYTANQFVDAASLNNFASGMAANIEEMNQFALGGLFRPELVSYVPTGLSLAVTLPSPFGVMFGDGVFARAHGTATNADTQNYTVDFTGVVPGSGTVTAYLIASETTIQQNPIQIIGPPPGHPDYDPTFVPFTAYNNNVSSLVLAATTTPPDNATTFELGRYSISASASGLAAIDNTNQVRLSHVRVDQTVAISGSVSATPAQAGTTFYASAALTLTLPPVSGMVGAIYELVAGSGTSSLQCNGADKIYGVGSNFGTGVGSVSLAPGTSLGVQGTKKGWQGTKQAGLTPAPPSVPVMTPIGGIMWWPNPTVPANYLECNGNAVSRTTFAGLNALAAAVSYGAPWGPGNGTTTFNLPDFRGYFIRAWDHGAGVDSGRSLGTAQLDSFASHTHTYVYNGDNSGGGSPGHGGGGPTNTLNTGSTGDTETRPINIALMPIIRYQ